MADTKLTREKLDVLREKAKGLLLAQKRQVLVCAGTGCVASGSMKVYDYLKAECEKRGIDVAVSLKEEAHGEGFHLKKSGCLGFCEIGPLLSIEPLGVTYTHVRVEDCDEIIEKTILGGEVIERLLYEQGSQRYQKREAMLSEMGEEKAHELLHVSYKKKK